MARTGVMSIAEALKILGLEKSAGEEEVKLAYRDLVKIWHPDRFQNDSRLSARTERQIKLINEARTTALNYLKKHGHFKFVEREKVKTPPPPPPKQEKPFKEQQPEAKPRKAPAKPSPTAKKRRIFSRRPKVSTNLLLVLVLVLAGLSFMFTLGESFRATPADRMKTYRQAGQRQNIPAPAPPGSLEDRHPENTALERPLSQNVADGEIDSFFTLGSDKEWVQKVQGPPLTIKGLQWKYGFSSIRFSGGKVVGWHSSELNPLKTGMLLDSNRLYTQRYFGIGSGMDEVAALQGAPDMIEDGVWSYGDAWVEFHADTVFDWENDRRETLLAK